jgi:hypothetical protein
MSEKKKTVSNSQYTVGEFLNLKSGISELNKKTLIRKFGKEKRNGGQWMDFLIISTISKEKDVNLLSTEIK